MELYEFLDRFFFWEKTIFWEKKTFFFKKKLLPHRQIKYPVDFDDELKTRKRQIR